MKKIFAFLLVAASTALFVSVQPVYAQENYFFGGIGSFQPTDEAMGNIYGSMIKPRVGFFRQQSKNFGWELAVGGMSKSGIPVIYSEGFDYVEGSCEVKLFQFEAIAKYIFNGDKTRFYAGGGLTYIQMSETITMTAWYEGESETVSGQGDFSAIGAVVVFGIDIPVNQLQTTKLFIQLSGSSAITQRQYGGDIDLGGGALEAGVRFKI